MQFKRKEEKSVTERDHRQYVVRNDRTKDILRWEETENHHCRDHTPPCKGRETNGKTGYAAPAGK